MTTDLQTVLDSNISDLNLIQHLDADQMVAVRVALAECRASVTRVQQEFVYIAVRMGILHKILGHDAFFPFVEQTLGIEKYRARRFLHINTSMTEHLATNEGKVDMNLVSRFTQGALRILAPVTDEAVIEEVRSLAEKGTAINEKVINNIIDSRKEDYEARIASAENEVEAATRAAKEADLKRELEVSRLTGQVNGSAEIIRRLNEQRAELEQEVSKLQSATTIVSEKEVPKVPEGYTTIEDAVADANKRLVVVQRQGEDALRAKVALEEELAKLQKSVTQFTAAHEDFLQVKTLIDTVMMKFPMAKLKAISEDPSQRAAISTMADAMVDLGTQLRTATAAVA